MKTNIYIRPETGKPYLQVSMDAKRKPIYNINIEFNIKDWDIKTQGIKERVNGHEKINSELRAIKKKARDEYDRLVQAGIKPTFELLKKAFIVELAEPVKGSVTEEKKTETLTFLSFMEERSKFEREKEYINKDYYKHVKHTLSRLTDFHEQYPFDFDNMDSDFFKSFMIFLSKGTERVYKNGNVKEAAPMLNNSLGTAARHLKRYCIQAHAKGHIKNMDWKGFKVLKEKVIKISYGEEDLLKVYNLKKVPDRMREAIDLNVFRFYAGGMRHGDSQCLRPENVITVDAIKNGKKVRQRGLYFAQNKTQEGNFVPLDKVGLEIWDRYKGCLPKFTTATECNRHMKQAFRIAGYKTKRLIIRHSLKKKIEKVVEEWELFGKSHVARYAVVKWVVQKTGNIHMAQGLLGHVKVETTEGYLGLDHNFKNQKYMELID